MDVLRRGVRQRGQSWIAHCRLTPRAPDTFAQCRTVGGAAFLERFLVEGWFRQTGVPSSRPTPAGSTGEAVSRSLDRACRDPWIELVEILGSSLPRSLDRACRDPWIELVEILGSSRSRSLDRACRDPWIEPAEITRAYPNGCFANAHRGSTYFELR